MARGPLCLHDGGLFVSPMTQVSFQLPLSTLSMWRKGVRQEGKRHDDEAFPSSCSIVI